MQNITMFNLVHVAYALFDHKKTLKTTRMYNFNEAIFLEFSRHKTPCGGWWVWWVEGWSGIAKYIVYTYIL